MNTLAIIQARMGSTRFPGKVLKDLVGKPMLWHIFNRLEQSNEIDKIILATSTNLKDNQLEQFAKELRIEYYRGSEDNVLDRYYEAAKKYKGDAIVRITGDCPVIDPAITDKVIRKHFLSNADYTSNTLKRTYPRGLDTEVIEFGTLERAFKEAKKSYQREHVTPYIQENPDKFRLESVEAEDILKRPDLRLTVDTKEDFRLIREIFEALYKENKIFYTESIIDLLDKNPELLKINAHIEQKKVKES